MKLFRRWYWFLSSFFKKYALGITLGVIGGIIAFSQGPKLLVYIPMKSNQSIGRVGSSTLSQLPLDIQFLVSRGLTKISDTGEIELDVAQTMSVSEDGTIYSFTLNPNLYWSNGEKFTSKDIDLQLNDVEITLPNDESIVFKLKEPFAPFPSILTQPILKRISTGRIFKKTRIIGFKSYVIANIKTQNQYIEVLTLTSEEGDRIYRFYPTEQEAVTAFKLGHIDQIDMMTAPYLEDWPNTSIEKDSTVFKYLALFFNTTDNNLQDKSIRQMLAYATPKTNGDQRIISPIPKESWVYNPQVKPYYYNLETAKGLMEKMKSSNNQLALEFTLTTTPAYVETAQKIIDSWLQLGVTTQLKVVAFPDTNDYQILLIGQQVPNDPDQYALWHSTQSTNITHYQNPKIDKLLEDGRKERDRETRKLIYQDFQRFLAEDSPVVFLEELYSYTVSRR